MISYPASPFPSCEDPDTPLYVQMVIKAWPFSILYLASVICFYSSGWIDELVSVQFGMEGRTEAHSL